ncbi:Ig-like domain-containing protein [Bradyrhizobium sp. USDA 223]|uniref:Ig-like domain-containing protein n=1 Tax=Bradyrhizobium sp. USDA 223 TaxID=3156306 RepID=UPI0038385F7D
MRIFALAAVLSLTPATAFAISECSVTGSPSVFGVDMTAYFAVKSGETCNFPMRIPGAMHRSGVARKPAHGKLSQVNVTTFRYTAASNYKGTDTFAIYGEGKGPYGSGKSVMTVNATIE